MEIYTFLWKQGNNSDKFLLRWALKKWRLIDMFNHLFSTLMLFFNLKRILPEMLMIPSLFLIQEKGQWMINNILKKLKKSFQKFLTNRMIRIKSLQMMMFKLQKKVFILLSWRTMKGCWNFMRINKKMHFNFYCRASTFANN